jgi:NAD(P)-dependent dehydrogenase (short-subunit alcohol dehydrogenase family)
MVEAGIKGDIINHSSKSGISYATGGHAHYASARVDIGMLTTTLERELLPYGISANALDMARTPINEDKWTDPELKKSYEARISSGRFALPIEMGYTMAFLASEKSYNIMGALIDVAGGMLIRLDLKGDCNGRRFQGQDLRRDRLGQKHRYGCH